MEMHLSINIWCIQICIFEIYHNFFENEINIKIYFGNVFPESSLNIFFFENEINTKGIYFRDIFS